MVGQCTLHHLHLYVADVVVDKHLLGHFAASQTAVGTYLFVFLELAFYIATDNH